MKKHGFSLAELLVALGIIAIGVSLMVPIFLNARPDRYKFRVINCYNLLNEVNERLLSNPTIYFRQPGNPNDGCRGLTCSYEPEDASGIPDNMRLLMTGACKYPLLLQEFMRIEPESHTTCTAGKISGKTHDGTQWNIKLNHGNIGGGYEITLTFPRSTVWEGNNCSYNATSCPSPNQFNFNVDIRGDVKGEDIMSKKYLNNITNIDKSDE